MMRRLMVAAAAAAVLLLSPAVFAQQGQLGTPKKQGQCSTALFAAVKADQLVALAMFNKGEGGFRDRDLYPYCFRIADGKLVAIAIAGLLGTDERTLKDPTGKGVWPADLRRGAEA